MTRAQRNQPATSNQSSASSSDYHSSAFESVARAVVAAAENSNDCHTEEISLPADSAAPPATPANQNKPAGSRTTRTDTRTTRTEDKSDTSKPSPPQKATNRRTTTVNRPSGRTVRPTEADTADHSEHGNRNERTLIAGNRPHVARRFSTIETQRARTLRQGEDPNFSVARAAHIQRVAIQKGKKRAPRSRIVACAVCNRTFSAGYQFDSHITGGPHQRALQRKSDREANLECMTCDLTFKSNHDYQNHIIGRRHVNKVRQQRQQ